MRIGVAASATESAAKAADLRFFFLSAGIVVRSIVLKLCRLALSAASTALRPSVSSMELDGVVRIV